LSGSSTLVPALSAKSGGQTLASGVGGFTHRPPRCSTRSCPSDRRADVAHVVMGVWVRVPTKGGVHGEGLPSPAKRVVYTQHTACPILPMTRITVMRRLTPQWLILSATDSGKDSCNHSPSCVHYRNAYEMSRRQPEEEVELRGWAFFRSLRSDTVTYSRFVRTWVVLLY